MLSLATFSDAYAVRPGCNPNIANAQKAIAQAKTLTSMAKAEQVIQQPDSTLALSCFDQAIKASSIAGALFSDSGGSGMRLGDALNDVVVEGLSGIMSNFTDSITQEVTGLLTDSLAGLASGLPFDTSFMNGAIGSVVGSLASMALPANDFDCNTMTDLWNTVTGDGIDTSVNIETFSDMFAGGSVAWAPTGTDFYDNLTSAAGNAVRTAVFDALTNTSVGLPSAVENTPVWAPGGETNLMDVLTKAGVAP